MHRADLGRPDRLWNYLYNRVARIYPALWTVTALALAVYASGFGGGDKAGKLRLATVLDSLLLLPQAGDPVVGVAWTLTYEVFFYAVFALMILRLRLGIAVLLLWQAATLADAATTVPMPALATYYLRPLCLDFSVGLGAAAWLAQPAAASPPAWWALLAAGAALFIAGMAGDALAWAGVACALGTGATIVALTRLERSGMLRVPWPLVTLGSASYAIYLVHYATLTVLVAIIGRTQLRASDGVCLGCATMAVLTGLAFDRALDRPVQAALQRAKRRLLQVPAAAPPQSGTA